ncbi:MAG: heparinase II/III family protein [Clostridia bacterium]|nr:heparinase II/III family protein [Clostridia bacterium]
MKLMEKATSPAFWETVRTSPDYQELREIVKTYYETSRYDEIPVLKFKPRMRFYADGDRSEFEAPYFRRRTYVSSAALLALIYPDEAGYVEEVEEIMMAICEEMSWCLPAHAARDLTDTVNKIDLFNAETGFTLAEICYLLEDRLDPFVLDRVKTEIKTRIADCYENYVYSWESNTANWAAVCAGNVGGALLYTDPELFEKHLPRLIETMSCFMSGFPEDGTCMEGFSYWHYGFGNFIWFADLLEQYTDGKTNLFTWDKVEAVSGYAQRSFLQGGATISYSDGTRSGKADRAMLYYLAKRFPESVQLLQTEWTYPWKGNCTWMQTLRNILYFDPAVKITEKKLADYDLPQAQQVIINREKYSLAAKGGNNNEPHNHNDVGSFILATRRGQVLIDYGAGRYTRQYFHPDTRYTVFCNSSLGHSVPIVNGTGQKEGAEFSGTLTHRDGVITIEMAGAYDIPSLTHLTRSFTYGGDQVILTDRFNPGLDSIVERFVTFDLPVIGEGIVTIGDVTLHFDPAAMTPAVLEHEANPHGTKERPSVAYCVDFTLAPGVTEASITFTM